MLRTFILNADGSVSLSTEKPAAQSKLAVILEVLQRRTYAAEEVMPLISDRDRASEIKYGGPEEFF